MTTAQNQISFVELAQQVLLKEKKPLTIDEIWGAAQAIGLLEQLATTGKTPKATLGARLYTDAKTPDGLFEKIGARPARFALKTLLANVSKEDLERQLPAVTADVTESFLYIERALHPLMVWFAGTNFAVHCKTIYHEKSVKKGPKHNQWIHPDIVGFALNTKDWNREVVDLAQRSGCKSACLFSFELKIKLDFSTLREYFFQAVSNSSWANQGYLVAAQIDEDPEFRDELERLSQSFGIGVIHLDASEPLDSEVLLPAHDNEVDWETINRVAEDNVDFRDFVAQVANSLKVNQVVAKGFDVALSDTELYALQVLWL